MIGADNQQERLDAAFWIVGFTDGEGCFSISFVNNPTTRFGKQIFPEFVVTQGEKSLAALKYIKEYFGCGGIFPNTRYDNHRKSLYRYCVRSIRDLHETIVPFFEQFPLLTHKQNDFLIFKNIIKLMIDKKHLEEGYWNMIMQSAAKMNRQKVRT